MHNATHGDTRNFFAYTYFCEVKSLGKMTVLDSFKFLMPLTHALKKILDIYL